MSKTKSSYCCDDCGSIANKWAGQCGDCGSWNTLVEVVIDKKSGFAGQVTSEIATLENVTVNNQASISTEINELNRVLGGNGIVTGSVVLIGGDPGIGKSTILLQALANISKTHNVLYITGEESLHQVKLRAMRLNLKNAKVNLLSETNIEAILALLTKNSPSVIVFDSVQTMYTDMLQSAPGSIGQVRESTAKLVRFAKQTGIAMILVGHVTKDGAIAGPRILEHMVDTVLYFEGQAENQFRILRTVKNRFGAVNEIGIFAMTESGLKEVNNPSAIFLSRFDKSSPGSVVMATKEGSRTMLVEIQALVNESHLAMPRRLCVGIDQNRLALILAVLQRHAGIATHNLDIFINVVGGVRITETGVDLPVLLAILSSLKNKPLDNDMVVFGEIGLTGEIRPVQSGQNRLKEAIKLGFKKAIVPIDNCPKNSKNLDMELNKVKFLSEAI